MTNIISLQEQRITRAYEAFYGRYYEALDKQRQDARPSQQKPKEEKK